MVRWQLLQLDMLWYSNKNIEFCGYTQVCIMRTRLPTSFCSYFSVVYTQEFSVHQLTWTVFKIQMQDKLTQHADNCEIINNFTCMYLTESTETVFGCTKPKVVYIMLVQSDKCTYVLAYVCTKFSVCKKKILLWQYHRVNMNLIWQSVMI